MNPIERIKISRPAQRLRLFLSNERVKTILSASVFIGIALVTFVIRFLNPLLTETQLLMYFWWVWLIEAILAIGVVLLFR